MYHVWARGVRKEAIFVDDEDRWDYLQRLGEVARDLEWSVLAFCLMPNHVHLLIELEKPNLGRGICALHGSYAREFNARHQLGGHLFEKRFGSNRLHEDGDVMYLACYVLLNPVRAALAARPDDYAWSSAAATLGLGHRPRWLAERRLLARFAGDAAAAHDRLVHVLEAVRILGAAGMELPPRNAETAPERGFEGAGGGTRTPDTRIMIPLL